MDSLRKISCDSFLWFHFTNPKVGALENVTLGTPKCSARVFVLLSREPTVIELDVCYEGRDRL